MKLRAKNINIKINAIKLIDELKILNKNILYQ